jgi:hypothetical protein
VAIEKPMPFTTVAQKLYQGTLSKSGFFPPAPFMNISRGRLAFLRYFFSTKKVSKHLLKGAFFGEATKEKRSQYKYSVLYG